MIAGDDALDPGGRGLLRRRGGFVLLTAQMPDEQPGGESEEHPEKETAHDDERKE